MADQTQVASSHEMSQSQSQSHDGGGQVQDTRLYDAVMSGKGCEPQANMQRGMGHGDALMEGVGSYATAAANNPGPAAADSGGSNDNSNTYQYSNHSLI